MVEHNPERSYSSIALILLPRQSSVVFVWEPGKPNPPYRKMPGGRVKPVDGNNPEKTALREISEEAGVKDVDSIIFVDADDKGPYDRYFYVVIKTYSDEEWENGPLACRGEDGEIPVVCHISDISSEIEGVHNIMPDHDDLLHRTGVILEINRGLEIATASDT